MNLLGNAANPQRAGAGAGATGVRAVPARR